MERTRARMLSGGRGELLKARIHTQYTKNTEPKKSEEPEIIDLENSIFLSNTLGKITIFRKRPSSLSNRTFPVLFQKPPVLVPSNDALITR